VIHAALVLSDGQVTINKWPDFRFQRNLTTQATAREVAMAKELFQV
jgi:hypothetical protein